MATEKTTKKAAPTTTTSAAAAGGKKRRRSSPKPTAATKKATTARTRKTKKNATAIPESEATANSTSTTASPAVPVSPPPSHILLVDNGGDSLKYGWMCTDSNGRGAAGANAESSYPHSLPNISARLMHQFTTLVGDELNKVQNPNSLVARTRSTERGIICNLENQTRVWKRMLDLLGVLVPTHTITAKCLGWKVATTAAAKKKKAGKKAAAALALLPLPLAEPTIPSHTLGVVLLLPPHCPRILLDQITAVWMEDFGVSHVGFGISSVCASYDQSLRTTWKTSCTVDLGWSSTLIVPTFQNQLIIQNTVTNRDGKKSEIETTTTTNVNKSGSPSTTPTTIRRMPIGGRHMINMLKYYMSYRQYNLMDQEVLMRDVFERMSFLSMDTVADLKLARRKVSGRRIYDRDFVLPDYTNTSRGEIRIPFALQKELEKEAQQKRKSEEEQQEEEQQEEDDDDEEEDEDFEGDDDEEDDENDEDEDEDFQEDEDNTNGISATKKTTKKKGNSKQRADVDNNKGNGDYDDDEEESMEEKRKRLLRERAEEDRRKREQQQDEQALRVSVERFVVPEVLFRPIDAGLQSDLVGLSQAIVQCVEACPEPYRPALYRTVYLVGGVARLPNLMERLKRELRSLVPSEYELEIFAADSPIDRAWLGAKACFEKEPYTKYTVSRQEWEESSKRKAYTKLLIENGGCYA